MSQPQEAHPDPEQVRRSLRRLARFIQEMDEQGRLLDAAPRLLKLMGDLRSQLFEYEVRHTRRLLPKSASAEVEGPGASDRNSKRIVQESLERQREAEEEWRRGRTLDDDV